MIRVALSDIAVQESPSGFGLSSTVKHDVKIAVLHLDCTQNFADILSKLFAKGRARANDR